MQKVKKLLQELSLTGYPPPPHACGRSIVSRGKWTASSTKFHSFYFKFIPNRPHCELSLLRTAFLVGGDQLIMIEILCVCVFCYRFLFSHSLCDFALCAVDRVQIFFFSFLYLFGLIIVSPSHCETKKMWIYVKISVRNIAEFRMMKMRREQKTIPKK